MLRLAPLLTLVPLAAAGVAWETMPHEEIDLDLPPDQRWVGLANKWHDAIVSRCKFMGKMFKVALGHETAERWVKAAPVDSTLVTEYDSIVRTVNDHHVTRDCLVLTDMWQAVNSPTFGCSAVLAAMPNGTVIHGRNIDYDTLKVAKMATKTGAGIGANQFLDVTLKRAGKPFASMLMMAGSLGTHTGIRFGSYTVNSNARNVNNKEKLNLQATEAGAKSFPWVMRKMVETVPDYETALKTIETTNFNAPNYFILAGSQSFQGAVVTADRKGTHEPSTPPTQKLDPAKGVWHLVQTNDDLLSPPEDTRRDAALMRLAKSRQSQVGMDFVEGEMKTEPILNSDTLVSWVGNPLTGTHRVWVRKPLSMAGGFLTKAMHRVLHMDMPQDLSKAEKSKGGTKKLRAQ